MSKILGDITNKAGASGCIHHGAQGLKALAESLVPLAKPIKVSTAGQPGTTRAVSLSEALTSGTVSTVCGQPGKWPTRPSVSEIYSEPYNTVAHGQATSVSTRASALAPAQAAVCASTHSGLTPEAIPVDGGDPQMVAEYVPDIFRHLSQDEGRHWPQPKYMDDQQEITAKMRGILVDWLVEVHQKYKLKNETLFLAINIIDRFLERRKVTRKRLQLVGVTGMLIAAKFEEIYPPEIRDFVYITDKAYSKEDILQMEVSMLTTLEFNLRVPTAIHFLDRFTRVSECPESHKSLVQYVLELTLPDIRFLHYSPSHLAAAALFLSNKLMKKHPSWPMALQQCTTYSESAIKGCAKEMCSVFERAQTATGDIGQLQAVKKKFALPKHHSTSKKVFT
jgi:cyclin B